MRRTRATLAEVLCAACARPAAKATALEVWQVPITEKVGRGAEPRPFDGKVQFSFRRGQADPERMDFEMR